MDRKRLMLLAVVAAVATFAGVQDRVTAAGARRYAAQARAAAAGVAPSASVEEVMGPAIDESVRRGALWGGVVLIGGIAIALARERRSRAATAAPGSAARSPAAPRAPRRQRSAGSGR